MVMLAYPTGAIALIGRRPAALREGPVLCTGTYGFSAMGPLILRMLSLCRKLAFRRIIGPRMILGLETF